MDFLRLAVLDVRVTDGAWCGCANRTIATVYAVGFGCYGSQVRISVASATDHRLRVVPSFTVEGMRNDRVCSYSISAKPLVRRNGGERNRDQMMSTGNDELTFSGRVVKMTMPGFTAEVSLYESRRRYRSHSALNGAGRTAITHWLRLRRAERSSLWRVTA